MQRFSRNILIVSASVGAGHTQAANAIKDAWEVTSPDDNITIVDFMDESNSHFNNFIKEVYLKTIQVSPDLYETVYRWTKDTSSGAKVQDLLSWAMRTNMMQIIQRHRPDVVICTHPFPCGAIAYLKRKGRLDIPIVGIITDFSVHSLWINQEVNQYIVAAPELKEELVMQGIPASRISATGIPIHPSFARNGATNSPSPARSENKPVLLIMGGGLGIGPMQDLLAQLNSLAFSLEIIFVTGSNTTLREKLSSLAANTPHNVKVLGYTQRVQELMNVADLLITKPGALTISEALAMKLPMLFFEAIPGQEKDNAGFVVAKGAARWLAMEDGITKQLNDLFADSGQLARMRDSAEKIGCPQSALSALTMIDRLMDKGLLVSYV